MFIGGLNWETTDREFSNPYPLDQLVAWQDRHLEGQDSNKLDRISS
jgi:hypothetical protein